MVVVGICINHCDEVVVRKVLDVLPSEKGLDTGDSSAQNLYFCYHVQYHTGVPPAKYSVVVSGGPFPSNSSDCCADDIYVEC